MRSIYRHLLVPCVERLTIRCARSVNLSDSNHGVEQGLLLANLHAILIHGSESRVDAQHHSRATLRLECWTSPGNDQV